MEVAVSSYMTERGRELRKKWGKPRVSGKPQKALASIQKKKEQEDQKEVRTQKADRLTQCCYGETASGCSEGGCCGQEKCITSLGG